MSSLPLARGPKVGPPFPVFDVCTIQGCALSINSLNSLLCAEMGILNNNQRMDLQPHLLVQTNPHCRPASQLDSLLTFITEKEN